MSHPPSLACVLFPGLVRGVAAAHKPCANITTVLTANTARPVRDSTALCQPLIARVLERLGLGLGERLDM